MQISKGFQAAISQTLRDNPALAIKYGSAEARRVIAELIAKNRPDLLDPDNPVDGLFATLAKPKTRQKTKKQPESTTQTWIRNAKAKDEPAMEKKIATENLKPEDVPAILRHIGNDGGFFEPL